MGPVKRYRAGVEPQAKTAYDDVNDNVFGTIAQGQAPTSRRKVVQAQILFDGGSAASIQKVEEAPPVVKRKPVAAQVVVESVKGAIKTGGEGKEQSSSEDDSDSDSSGSGSSDSDTDDDSEDAPAPPAQITFVPKSKRVDTATKAEEKARHDMELQIKEKKERQKRSREMANESVTRKTAEEEGPGSEDEEGYPDDSDGKDDRGEYQAWKIREILRLNKYEKRT